MNRLLRILLFVVLCESAIALAAQADPMQKPEAWQPGRHYTLLIPSVPTSVGTGKVEVVEVFSYTCGACYALEPHMVEWKKRNSPDVEFIRIPVVWRPDDRAYARLFYTLQALGKAELHSALFARTFKNRSALYSKDTSQTLELQRKFAEEHGIGREAFLSTYNSPGVLRSIDRAEALAHRYLVDRTPTLVINGKYASNVVRTGWDPQQPEAKISFEPLLRLVDDLVNQERESTRHSQSRSASNVEKK